MSRVLSLAIISLFLVSCAVSKPKVEVSENKKEVYASEKKIYNTILRKSDFDALKITSKVSYENLPSANATIYIENNQKIWMNISALFINVARGVATPQGLKAYEKVDKTYIDSDFTYINDLLGINFIDYQALQDLFLGKVFIPINEKDFLLMKKEQGYVLKTKNSQKITTNGKTSEYLVDLYFSNDFNLEQVLLRDAKSTDQLQLFYENWEVIERQKLPQNVKIIIKGKKSKQILIENTKFEFSKMETPYRVPNNYKKREF